jgi:predicted acyl esterase
MIENVLVAMPDGVRLAVQLWLPAEAEHRPAPVVLEYIPYRKRDRYRGYGMYWGRTLASQGVAYARLETRGSGDSTGVLEDEYLASEQDDAVATIAWLAAQPWCNGAVGMRGVSWGGFSALQVAALAPPALKAIMPMCASDMRYTDDAHYIGGVFALTGLKWATSFKLVMAGPPDPEISGEGWLEAWRSRLAATPPIAARWLAHQTNDAYWRAGSVGVDLEAIACPVYVVGGLVDSYSNAIPRLLAHLEVPKKGLLGPWRHGYPAPASPGPALDWAFEEVRWWRHWLIGEETGIMAEPMFRAFMPQATAAQVAPGPIPGRWIAEAAWPSRNIATRTFYFGDGVLSESPMATKTLALDGAAVVGLGKIEWVPFAPTELPAEQSADDVRSLVFDTLPLEENLELLGAPLFHAQVACDQEVARLAIRLCELTPAGESWLVTYGLLNLCHRDGHGDPRPLEPGRRYDVEIPLGFVAHRFAAGSRIRAAVSESLWPLVWPSPRVATVTLGPIAARLDLPIRSGDSGGTPMPIPLAPPAASDPASWPVMEVAELDGNVTVVETWPISTVEVKDIGETISGAGPNIALAMTAGDPSSCVWRAWQTARYQRPGRDIELRAEVAVSASPTHFLVEERLIANLDGETAADASHTDQIARRWM